MKEKNMTMKETLIKLEREAEAINAIERVLDKRTSRGASDESLINWLNGLKHSNKWFNSVLDGFIDAIKQTPLNNKGGKP